MWSSKDDDLAAWSKDSKVESFESVVRKLEEMASKKKQDEKNLKILRELVATPCNKHCFDCQQRGPTYVDMTIGSFVCTTCSGLLRGLTPPHRVKSISMASFTDEEILMLKSRGNEYCRRVWLGLYDPAQVTDVSSESQVKDFMINKYEKKRYYLDPSKITMPISRPQPVSSVSTSHQKPQTNTLALPRTTPNNNHSNNNGLNKQPDPFSPVTSTPVPQDNFANFDSNPIFNATAHATPTKQQNFSLASQDLEFLTSAFSTPAPTFTPNHNFSWFNPWSNMPMSTTSTPAMSSNNSSPAQDRYAALKDLDSMMRASTNTSPWGSNGSTSVFDTPQSQASGTPTSMFMDSSVSQSSPGNPFVVNESVNNNPWGSATPPSFSQPAAFSQRTNPFDAPTNGFSGNHQAPTEVNWAANFQDSPFSSPMSQVSGFSTPENNNKGWNFVGNNYNNPFSLGGGSTPAKSSNPFL